MVVSMLELPITYQKEEFLAFINLFGLCVLSNRHHTAQPMRSSLPIYLSFVESFMESFLSHVILKFYPIFFKIQRTVNFQLEYVNWFEIWRQSFFLIDRLTLEELFKKLLVELFLVYAQKI